MKFVHTRVKTLDSYKHPGQPIRFEVGVEHIEVDQVLDHWNEAYVDPSFFPCEYYKVADSNGKVYLLRYSTLFKSWWLKEDPGEEQ
jgi:hypothetical protein